MYHHDIHLTPRSNKGKIISECFPDHNFLVYQDLVWYGMVWYRERRDICFSYLKQVCLVIPVFDFKRGIFSRRNIRANCPSKHNCVKTNSVRKHSISFVPLIKAKSCSSEINDDQTGYLSLVESKSLKRGQNKLN